MAEVVVQENKLNDVLWEVVDMVNSIQKKAKQQRLVQNFVMKWLLSPKNIFAHSPANNAIQPVRDPYRFGRGRCSGPVWVYRTSFILFKLFMPIVPFLKELKR